MKFDKNNCLGGRINGKEVVGIRYGGYTIFPKDEYNIIYSFKGEDELYTRPSLSDMPGYIETITTDSDGITTRNVKFNAAPMELIRFSYNTKSISKLKCCFSRYCIGDASTSYSQLEFIDLSETDTSNVTNMFNMFIGCANLTTLDLSNFDTSNVTNMNYMFYDCTKLETLDLRNWDASSVDSYWEYSTYRVSTEMMFSRCSSLHTIRLDNCSRNTVNRIINSMGFPNGTIDGVTRKIYIDPEIINERASEEENYFGEFSQPSGWVFVNCETNEVIN